jgi:uncharacterized membrane protein
VRRIVAQTVVLSAAALWLVACSPEAPGGGEAQPPADAPPAEAPPPPAEVPAEFAQDFSAAGNEPFWRVDIKGKEITFSGPAAETVDPDVATNAGLATTPDGATWTAQAGTTPVLVKVTRGDCSDGMSDAKYLYSAEVTWGTQTFKGCGFPTDEQPRGDGQ